MSILGRISRASIGLCIIAAAACSEDSKPSVGTEPLPASDDSGSEHIASITSGLKARATDFGEGHIHVDMVQNDGGVAFAADFKLKDDTLNVEHTLFTTASDGKVTKVSDARKVPAQPGDVITYQSAIDTTIMLHKNISGGMLGLYAANNDWGCDLGQTIGMVASCSNKGKCCDTHDTCYEQHGCKWDSWVHPLTQATCEFACNVPVVGCMALSNPGPSQCCGTSLNYCGLTRTPGTPPPTTQPSASTPRFGSPLPAGAKIPQPANAKKPTTTNRTVAQSGFSDAGVDQDMVPQDDNPTSVDGGMDSCDPNTDENCQPEACAEGDPECQQQACDPSSGEPCPDSDAGTDECDPSDPTCQTQACDENDPSCQNAQNCDENDPSCQTQACDENDPNCQNAQNCDPNDPSCQTQNQDCDPNNPNDPNCSNDDNYGDSINNDDSNDPYSGYDDQGSSDPGIWDDGSSYDDGSSSSDDGEY